MPMRSAYDAMDLRHHPYRVAEKTAIRMMNVLLRERVGRVAVDSPLSNPNGARRCLWRPHNRCDHGHRFIPYTSNGTDVRATRGTRRQFRAGSNDGPSRKHLGLARPSAHRGADPTERAGSRNRRDKIAARHDCSSGGSALSTASASLSRVTPGSYGAWPRIIPLEPLRVPSVVHRAERPAAIGDPCRCRLPAW